MRISYDKNIIPCMLSRSGRTAAAAIAWSYRSCSNGNPNKMLSRTLALYMKADCGTYATCMRHAHVSAYVLQGMGCQQCTTWVATSFDSLSSANGEMVLLGLMLQLSVNIVISGKMRRAARIVAHTKRRVGVCMHV